MNFADILYNLMVFIYENLVNPFVSFFVYYSDDLDLFNPITFTNFGSDTTMFVASFNDILVIAIGLMVSITALVLSWKFVKMLSNFVRRLFGGVRK